MRLVHQANGLDSGIVAGPDHVLGLCSFLQSLVHVDERRGGVDLENYLIVDAVDFGCS